MRKKKENKNEKRTHPSTARAGAHRGLGFKKEGKKKKERKRRKEKEGKKKNRPFNRTSWSTWRKEEEKKKKITDPLIERAGAHEG